MGLPRLERWGIREAESRRKSLPASPEAEKSYVGNMNCRNTVPHIERWGIRGVRKQYPPFYRGNPRGGILGKIFDNFSKDYGTPAFKVGKLSDWKIVREENELPECGTPPWKVGNKRRWESRDVSRETFLSFPEESEIPFSKRPNEVPFRDGWWAVVGEL